MGPLNRFRTFGLPAALVLVAATGAMSGCGGGAVSPGGSSSAAPTKGSPGSTAPSSGTSQPGTALQVTGEVIEGLRPSCVVLQAPDRRYALTGEAAKGLRPGDRVTVTGVVRHDLVNPCGLTLVVSRTSRGAAGGNSP